MGGHVLLGTGIAPSFGGHKNQPSKWRHYVGGTAFLMASALFCFGWAGIPLNNIYYVDGFPQAVPTTDGWRSSRYGWSWWTIWMLGLNFLMPYFLSAALVNNKVPEYARIHYWLGGIMILLNVIIFLMLSVQWLFFCNGGSTYYASACNNIRWCCVHFAASPSAAQWCPNTMSCDPNFTTADLSRTLEFFVCWLFSILFVLWSWAHRRVNRDLRNYGVFGEKI